MKEFVFMLLGMAVGVRVMAQGLSVIFQQNKTQLREMGEQIAALQGLAATLEDGYAAVGGRLDSIGMVKQGDFDMHTGHLGGLREVSSAVRTDSRIETILLFGNEDDLDWLTEVLTNGRLEMSDAERLRQLDELCRRVKEEFIKKSKS